MALKKKQSNLSKSKANKASKNRIFTYVTLSMLLLSLMLLVFVSLQNQDPRSRAAGEKSNQTSLSYSAEGYTSQYHLYAEDLDWSKSVGLLLYTDGSGEYGLKNPGNSYLLGGNNGLIAVAKKHNMILLTPLSPNKACSDGDGSCWYLGDPPGYTRWAESLVKKIQAEYPIAKNRVAVGGYSSGAQFSTEYWVPSGAAQRTMTDGVIVAISFGGSPKVKEVGYDGQFKPQVHMNWNSGDKDSSYTTSGQYGVKAGHSHFTKAGFATSIDVIPGKGHARNGEFGAIMDAQIAKHVPPPTATAQAPIAQKPTTPQPTYFCMGNCAPSVSPTAKLAPNTQKNIQNPGISPKAGDNLTGNAEERGFLVLFLTLIGMILQFLGSLIS